MSVRTSLACAVACASLFSLAAGRAVAADAGAAPPALQAVVVVSRHGVRSPTKLGELDAYAAQPWPAWPVGPSELTPHGAMLMTAFGRAYRESFAAAGLGGSHPRILRGPGAGRLRPRRSRDAARTLAAARPQGTLRERDAIHGKNRCLESPDARSRDDRSGGERRPRRRDARAGRHAIRRVHRPRHESRADRRGAALSWFPPGFQQNEMPPGGALVFEVWRPVGGGAAFVCAPRSSGSRSIRCAMPTVATDTRARPMRAGRDSGLPFTGLPACELRCDRCCERRPASLSDPRGAGRRDGWLAERR